MLTWEKEQKEFSVTLFYNERRGNMTTIPKPVVKQLGDPDRIVFKINKKGKIGIRGERQPTLS